MIYVPILATREFRVSFGHYNHEEQWYACGEPECGREVDTEINRQYERCGQGKLKLCI